MRASILPSLAAFLLCSPVSGDQPAVAPAYKAPAPVAPTNAPYAPYGASVEDTYSSPSSKAGSVAVAPDTASVRQDTYGSPSAPAPVQPDTYGSPQGAAQTTYSSPAQTAGPGNQGYYYYYYPVRQQGPAAAAEAEDDGLLGLLGGAGLAGLLSTKVLLLVLGLAGFVLITSLGINLGGRRSFSSRALSAAQPYLTQGNLITMLESVNSALHKYQ